MRSLASVSILVAALALAACSTKPGAEPQVAASPELASAPSATSAQRAGSAPRPGCGENFAAFDGNADQRVSLDEFLERPHAHPDPEAVFRSRDGDADGSLTSEEFCAGWHGGPGGGHGRGPGGHGPGMGRGGHARCDAQLTRFDSDHDGKVSDAEFAALPHPHGDAQALFTTRDQDHDGFLTPAEFCAPWAPTSSEPPAASP